MFDKVLLAVYVHPGKPDLFCADERLALVQESLKDEPRMRVASYDRLTVDYAREVGAQAIVRGLRVFLRFRAGIPHGPGQSPAGT